MNGKHEARDGTLGIKDGIAAAALLTLFIVMLIATWQRWTHPVIDHAREMNIPARLLSGDRLYIDIYYYYGPVAPYLNAALYALFGTHLSVLHASGAVAALLILAMMYWIARQLLTVIEAAVTIGLVLIICALPPYFGNYLQPYAYAALYGWTFALASLVCLLRAVTRDDGRAFRLAGLFIGLTMACKPELGMLGFVPAAAVWVVDGWFTRRLSWRIPGEIVVPALLVAGVTYGAVASLTPWRTLVADTVRSFSQPQMMYFARWLNGQADWPFTGFALVASIGMTLLVCGLAAIAGLMFDSDAISGSRRHLWKPAVAVGAGWLIWTLPPRGPAYIDLNPYRTAPLVLPATLGFCCWRLWRARARRLPPARADLVLLVLALFSLVAIGRVLFNVSLGTPYTIFTVPALILVYAYLLLRASPHLFATSAAARALTTRAAVVLMAIAGGGLTVYQTLWSRAYFRAFINAPHGSLLTSPGLAGPFNEAIRFASDKTAPGEPVVTLPVGSLINFFADRPNPLPDEIVVPGYLTPDRERATIETIEARRVRLVFLVNWRTPEYRDIAFGVDYNQDLARWIEQNYQPVATFVGSGRDGRELKFGDLDFFIRAYERRTE